MSLGGGGPPVGTCATTTDPEHQAICRSTAAGVTYVVAAGNSGWDFDYAPDPDVPAAYPEVLTVTAVERQRRRVRRRRRRADLPHRRGRRPLRELLELRRHAAGAGAHDRRARRLHPLDLRPAAATTTMSGTSMASPHMAGAVALCLGEGGASRPVRRPDARRRSSRRCAPTPQPVNQANTCSASPATRCTPGLRPLLRLPRRSPGTAAPAPPPLRRPTPVSAAPAGTTIQTGRCPAARASSLAGDDSSSTGRLDDARHARASWYGRFTAVPSDAREPEGHLQGQGVEDVLADPRGVPLDRRHVGNARHAHDLQQRDPDRHRTPAGDPSGYVSPGGEVRARVTCTRTKDNYSISGTNS